jgi:hypothetical protein
MEVYFEANLNGGQTIIIPMIRCSADGQNGYLLAISNIGSIDGAWEIHTVVSGVLGSIHTFVPSGSSGSLAGKNLGIRFKVQGTTISAKIWPLANTEPSAYSTSVVDSTISAPGYFGFWQEGASTGSAIDNVSLDDLIQPATNFSLTPSSLSASPGAPTGNYTIALNGPPSASVAIALSDGGAGGAFTPASLTIDDQANHSFTYTPAAGATSSPITLTATASGGIVASQSTQCALNIPATAFTLTPANQSTTPSAATGDFTVTLNGSLQTIETVNFSDSGAGGTFSPPSLAFTQGGVPAPQTFTYTPPAGSAGSTIQLTATGGGQFSLSRQASCTVTAGPVAIPVSDPNVFFSPFNWFVSGSAYAISATNGAYVKLGFTGTSLKMNLDISAYAALYGDSTFWPNIRWSIDDGPFSNQKLTSASGQLTLASGLADGAHTLYFCMVGTQDGYDRWGLSAGADPQSALKITGFAVDSGRASAAPSLSAKRVLIFGDSITEGVEANAFTGSPNVDRVDSQLEYSAFLGQGLGAEYGQVGFGGLGWTIASAGGSPPGAVAFFTPGQDVNSSWNKYSNGRSRLVGGLLNPAPDIIAVNLGRNDNNRDQSAVTASVSGWLAAARAAAPAAWIFVIVPFDGSCRAAITGALDAYVTANSDAKAALIDLGLDAHFNQTTTATDWTMDGNHPVYWANGQIAAALAKKIQEATGGSLDSGSAGYSRSRVANE